MPDLQTQLYIKPPPQPALSPSYSSCSLPPSLICSNLISPPHTTPPPISLFVLRPTAPGTPRQPPAFLPMSAWLPYRPPAPHPSTSPVLDTSSIKIFQSPTTPQTPQTLQHRTRKASLTAIPNFPQTSNHPQNCPLIPAIPRKITTYPPIRNHNHHPNQKIPNLPLHSPVAFVY